MSHDNSKSNMEDVPRAGDPNLYMQALVGELRRVMRLELEQVHERMDRIENERQRQPQLGPNVRRRERVQPRDMRVEDEEF